MNKDSNKVWEEGKLMNYNVLPWNVILKRGSELGQIMNSKVKSLFQASEDHPHFWWLTIRNLRTQDIIVLTVKMYYSDTRRTSRKIIGGVWKNKCTGFLFSVLYHTEHTFLPLGKMQHHVCFCPGKPDWDQQFRVLIEGRSCKQVVPSNYEKQEFTINHSVVQTEETQQTNLTTKGQGNILKAKVPDANQGPTLQAGPSKDRSLCLLCNNCPVPSQLLQKYFPFLHSFDK